MPISKHIIYANERLSKQLDLLAGAIELVTLRMLEIELKLDKLEIKKNKNERISN